MNHGGQRVAPGALLVACRENAKDRAAQLSVRESLQHRIELNGRLSHRLLPEEIGLGEPLDLSCEAGKSPLTRLDHFGSGREVRRDALKRDPIESRMLENK